jgi:hypothetical protein
MTQKEKLLKRFLSRPKDFTWDELATLLSKYGYKLAKHGKTGGSRRRFIHESLPPISLHKPHPKKIIKMYVIDEVTSFLKREKLI